jgi:hypothetical protein
VLEARVTANIIEAAFYATASLGFVELWRLAMPRSIPAIRKSDTLAAQKRKPQADQSPRVPTREDVERMFAAKDKVEERRRDRA